MHNLKTIGFNANHNEWGGGFPVFAIFASGKQFFRFLRKKNLQLKGKRPRITLVCSKPAASAAVAAAAMVVQVATPMTKTTP